jgi:tRNA threonylcarbamoyladenosine biosynthesis protein TsaB
MKKNELNINDYETKNPPLSLAVETSGRVGSVAIGKGDKLLAHKDFSAPMKHSAEVFTAAEELLSSIDKTGSDVEHVYITHGPGSFTGLRIAVTLAKTMALANSAKIVALRTSDVIAANVAAYVNNGAPPPERLATILDAKRAQFFVAVYELEDAATLEYEKIYDDQLIRAADFLDKFTDGNETISLMGEGLVYYKDKFNAPGVEFLDEQYWWPNASNVHKLGSQKATAGQFDDPLTLEPLYIQRPDVKMKK